MGPNILPDFLSILSSIVAYKSKEVVLDEKLIWIFYHLSESNFVIKAYVITDLAVPLSPTIIKGLLTPPSLICLLKI